MGGRGDIKILWAVAALPGKWEYKLISNSLEMKTTRDKNMSPGNMSNLEMERKLEM